MSPKVCLFRRVRCRPSLLGNGAVLVDQDVCVFLRLCMGKRTTPHNYTSSEYLRYFIYEGCELATIGVVSNDGHRARKSWRRNKQVNEYRISLHHLLLLSR